VTHDDLQRLLTAAWEVPVVEEGPQGGFTVLVPRLDVDHDWRTVTVVPEGDGWVIDDGGATSFWLDSAFDRAIDVYTTTGTALERSGDTVVLRSNQANLPRAIISMAAELSAIEHTHHVLAGIAASRAARRLAEGASDVMARELKANVTMVLPKVGPRIRLKQHLGGKVMSLNVPWALMHPGGGRAVAVASFIDLEQTPTVVRAALGTTSLTLDVARLAHVDAKFVVVRGGDGVLGDISGAYETEATMVDSTDLTQILDRVQEIDRDLLPA
jgi:hypothetical protein